MKIHFWLFVKNGSLDIRYEYNRYFKLEEYLLVVDANGVVCPKADNRLYFTAEGAAELLTTDNGDPRETESFARGDKKALAGHVVGCARALEDVKGEIVITVTAEGLEGESIKLAAE